MIATTPSLNWEIFRLGTASWELVAAFPDTIKAGNYAREQCKRSGLNYRVRDSKTDIAVDFTRRKLGNGFVVDGGNPFETEVAR